MKILEAMIFGLTQGLTEFLPVSSSGHLYLVQNFLNIETDNLAFFVLLHFATLLAVLVFFLPQILALKKRELVNLLIASIPIVPFTLVVKDLLPLVASSSLMIGVMLSLTGLLNLSSFFLIKENEAGEKKNSGKFNAFKVGIFQALAIFPGISRSGITLNASLRENIDQKKALSFTFLLSVPAILGAVAFEAWGSSTNLLSELDLLPSIIGMLTAFLAGLLALKIFKKALKNNQFIFFAIYCLALGVFLILAN